MRQLTSSGSDKRSSRLTHSVLVLTIRLNLEQADGSLNMRDIKSVTFHVLSLRKSL